MNFLEFHRSEYVRLYCVKNYISMTPGLEQKLREDTQRGGKMDKALLALGSRADAGRRRFKRELYFTDYFLINVLFATCFMGIAASACFAGKTVAEEQGWLWYDGTA